MITGLDELTEACQRAVPETWTAEHLVATQNVDNVAVIKWSEEGEERGFIAFEFTPIGLGIVGFETAGVGVFRGLCRELPEWARQHNVANFFVSSANEQSRIILDDAGFVPMTPTEEGPQLTWIAEITEEQTPMEVYGNDKKAV